MMEEISFEIPDKLDRLDHAEYRVRRKISININTPPEVLAYLANDKDEWVRIGVAWNKNTPPEVLAKLVEDVDRGVRRGVARNKNTPPEILG